MLTKALTTVNRLEDKLLFYKMISTYDTRQAVTGKRYSKDIQGHRRNL
jgi:hypothetical protein